MILNKNKSCFRAESIFNNEIARQQNAIKSVKNDFQNGDILYQNIAILEMRFCCFKCFLTMNEKQNKKVRLKRTFLL